MNIDWTFISRSWLWEEEDEFKNESIGSDWTEEEDRSSEETIALYINDPVLWPINSRNVPLPQYRFINGDQRNIKNTFRGVRRGKPWTEDEHRRFLMGLEEYGRGDWKSIARYYVRTKTNSQVASHAQKYFKRMNSTSHNAKRHSINDVTLDYPRTNVQKLPLRPTDFIDMSTLFSNHRIEEPLGFSGSTSAIKSIQELGSGSSSGSGSAGGSAGALIYHPSFPLVEDNGRGIHNPFSGDVHVLPEIQHLNEDNNVQNPGLFDFSFMNEIDSVMQNTGMNLGSSDVPFLSELQPLVYDDDRAPSYGLSEISSTPDSRQPLLQENGVQGSVPSFSTETVDPDIFALPHFLDI